MRRPECDQWLPGAGRHCRQPARLFPVGWRCPDHTPAAERGQPEPPTTPMERRST